MARTRCKLQNFDLKVWPWSLTIESWVLYATRLLNMLNLSIKLYENTIMICEVTAMTRSDGRTHVHSNIANCGKRDRQKVTIHRNNTDINLIIKLVHGICNMKLSNIFPIIPKRDLDCIALKITIYVALRILLVLLHVAGHESSVFR